MTNITPGNTNDPGNPSNLINEMSNLPSNLTFGIENDIKAYDNYDFSGIAGRNGNNGIIKKILMRQNDESVNQITNDAKENIVIKFGELVKEWITYFDNLSRIVKIDAKDSNTLKNIKIGLIETLKDQSLKIPLLDDRKFVEQCILGYKNIIVQLFILNCIVKGVAYDIDANKCSSVQYADSAFVNRFINGPPAINVSLLSTSSSTKQSHSSQQSSSSEQSYSHSSLWFRILTILSLTESSKPIQVGVIILLLLTLIVTLSTLGYFIYKLVTYQSNHMTNSYDGNYVSFKPLSWQK